MATMGSLRSSLMSTTTARPDLLVADDSTPNYLYLNKGDGTFEDASYASGYALNENGSRNRIHGHRATETIGTTVFVDFYNTTFSDDYNPLYRNDGNANFTDVSYPMGIAEPTVPFLGWGDGVLGLRQRRLEGYRDCKRPCLPVC